MKQSLGEILQENAKRNEQDKIDEEARIQAEKKANEVKQRKVIGDFFEQTKELITKGILEGKSTIRIQANSSNKFQYVYMRITNGEPAFVGMGYADIWYNFQSWLEASGLEVVLVHDHDGIGMSSWTTMVIRPAV